MEVFGLFFVFIRSKLYKNLFIFIKNFLFCKKKLNFVAYFCLLTYNSFKTSMEENRLLTIQDISCLGQCSITVALPVLSACGIETCILPSAVLSTHTVGFNGVEYRDFTNEMVRFANHWRRENILFDGLYTGYIACAEQIDNILKIAKDLLKKNAKIIIDPAMADDGVMYPAFDESFVCEMKKLCRIADIILPNITEACLLTDTEYRREYDPLYIDSIVDKLMDTGAKTIVLTGVGFVPESTGVLVCEKGKREYYSHSRLNRACHGSGDVFASAFVGALYNGKTCVESAKIAADFTFECIKNTFDDANHWYGLKFEKCLKDLMRNIF